MNKKLELALSFLAKKWSILPCGKNKIPLIPWKTYQSRLPTEIEVRSWFVKFPDAEIGIITGRISNLTVVDVEKGGDTSFLPQNTMIVKTGGMGYHYYFLFEEGVTNKARIRPLCDLRAEGGFVVAHGSVSDKGSYELIKEAPLLPFPKELFPEKVDIFQYQEKVNNINPTHNYGILDYPGYGQGQRNDQMARFIGKTLVRVHPSEWETIAWSVVESANTKNTPPLTQRELRTTFDSIKRTEIKNSPGRWLNNNYGGTFNNFNNEPEVLSDGEDEVKHITEVAEDQKIDITDIYPLQMPIFDEAICGGVIPGDVVVVSAKTGEGKTTLCQDWTMSLVRGTKKVKVLWFSYELMVSEIWRKFQEMGATKEDMVFAPAKHSTGNLDWVERKIKEAKEKFGIKAVVIDHLGFLLPKIKRGMSEKSISSNYATYLTQIVREIKTMALQEEVIIFLPVHMKKKERRSDGADLEDLKDCIASGQKVVANNKLIPIEKIKKGNKILAFGPGQTLISKRVKDIWETGEKNIYEIKTKSGRVLKCSNGHRFYAIKNEKGGGFGPNKGRGIQGWTKLSELKVGQKIAVARTLPIESKKKEISNDAAKLLGWIVGDGHITKFFNVVVTSGTIEEALEVKKLATSGFDLSCRITPYKDKKAFNIFLSNGNKIKKGEKRINNKLTRFLKKISFNPAGKQKHIPDFILKQSNDVIASFLSGLFQADGYVGKHKKSPVITYSTISKRLADEIIFCLAKLGIFARLTPQKHKGYFNNSIPGSLIYIVSLYGIDIISFSEKIKFATELKQAKTLEYIKGWKPLRLKRKGNLFFEPIKSIKLIGREKTWDIEVESKKDKGHSFVVEGILTHNSSGPGQESDLVFLIERERNKDKDADSYFTDLTKIFLAKNRRTGITKIGRFTMMNGRFVQDATDKEFKEINKDGKKEEKVEEVKIEKAKEIPIPYYNQEPLMDDEEITIKDIDKAWNDL